VLFAELPVPRVNVHGSLPQILRQKLSSLGCRTRTSHLPFPEPPPPAVCLGIHLFPESILSVGALMHGGLAVVARRNSHHVFQYHQIPQAAHAPHSFTAHTIIFHIYG
jgi:hypothetical protein